MRRNTIAILVDLFRSGTVHLLLYPIWATLLVRRRWRCGIGSINPNKRQIAIYYRSRIPAISRETSQIAEKIYLTFQQVRGRIRVGIGGPIFHPELNTKKEPIVQTCRLQIAIAWIALVGMLFVPPVLGASATDGCRCQTRAGECDAVGGGCCCSCRCGEECACHLRQNDAPPKPPAQAPPRDEIRPVNVAIALPMDAVAGRGSDSVLLAAIDSPLQAPSALAKCALLSRFLL